MNVRVAAAASLSILVECDGESPDATKRPPDVVSSRSNPMGSEARPFRTPIRPSVWWACFQIEAGCCYETTLALGHDAEAREIADTSVACLPTLQTFATLVDAALASGRARVAQSLLGRARAELDRGDALRLERRLASA